MGLDFRSDGCELEDKPSWSYSGFMSFRTKLASMTDIGDLRTMEGFPRYHLGPNLDIIFDGAEKTVRSWDEIDDAIVPLINHSDCDGELSPDECRTVAPRLRELLSQLDVDHSYDLERGLLLAKMMDDCALRNVPLIFC